MSRSVLEFNVCVLHRQLRIMYALVADDVSAEEIVSSIPEADTLARLGVESDPEFGPMHPCHMCGLSSPVYAALLCEKIDR